ncbi:hypothetical protein AKJ09_11063 [Labilithrix luteola]|uniref:Uncharacterized protein n=2 Tax=Labilithrix luteola TaxID=1391654 RepID=A0A0K1QG39_9BACT|nr:hypothetical protein AKJ09_11063 [Labilithrix luteola]
MAAMHGARDGVRECASSCSARAKFAWIEARVWTAALVTADLDRHAWLVDAAPAC